MLGDRLGQQYHKTKRAKDYFKGLMKVVKARDEEKPARTQNVGNPEELFRKQERRSELDIESGWEKYTKVLSKGGAYDRRDGEEGSLSRALKQQFTETDSEKAARIRKRDEDFYKRFPKGVGSLGADFD
jgi:hypothetical protein